MRSEEIFNDVDSYKALFVVVAITLYFEFKIIKRIQTSFVSALAFLCIVVETGLINFLERQTFVGI